MVKNLNYKNIQNNTNPTQNAIQKKESIFFVVRFASLLMTALKID